MVKTTCVTDKGGAVEFGDKREVWASYAVVTVGDSPPPELFYAGVSLPFGHVQFFVNRETGLVTVNTIKRGQKGGTEVYSARLTHGAKAD